MKWAAPPDRRELTLLLFSLTVYLISYNIDSSLRLLGFDPVAAQGAVLTRLGFSETQYIGDDGRKPEGWRDSLEEDVYGTWAWDKGHVAGDGLERSQAKGIGRHGAMWMNKDDVGETTGKFLGETTVDHALGWWKDDIPVTNLVKHVPGYTILDNVIIFNGTTYIVTNDQSSFPKLESIVATASMDYNNWTFVTVEEGRAIFGGYGGVIPDVTWMSADKTPHNSTLLALWRTYSSLDTSIDAHGRSTLPPPFRLVFPNNRFYTDANPPFEQHWVRRRRVDTGFHPYLLKAVFPHLTCVYYEDWEDYHKMQVPFVIERIVIADRVAADKWLSPSQPVFSSPFSLEVSAYWWEPVRRTLTSYYDLDEDAASKPVVTYLQRQGETNGARIRPEDHELLVRSLKDIARTDRFELQIVSTSTFDTKWDDKMAAIARSTVVIGVYGDHLFDGMFMRRSPKSTLIELFRGNEFERDRELAAQSIGLEYIAMMRDSKFTSEDLPPVSLPNSDQLVQIDAGAVAEAVRSALSGW
ncbi:hypothetical protein AX17_002506 [Amanita inopinata Kibby_2008]|nr:hypothetical protein AX17_002506 [Amanita inopinata Kibby_2008]